MPLRLIICLFGLLLPETAIGQTTQLTWKFEKGLIIDVEMTQSSTVSMGPMSGKTETKSWMTWRVLDTADEVASVGTTINRMTVSNEMGDKSAIVFDSDLETDAGPAAQIAALLRPIIGVQSVQTMNSSGEVLDVRIPKELTEAFEKGPQGINLASTIEELAKNSSLKFPEPKLSVGQSWESESKTKSQMGAIKVKNTYTYRGPVRENNKELHKIDLQMTLAFETDQNQVQMDISNQKNKGAIYFDNDAGIIHRSEMKQEFDLKVKVGSEEMSQKTKTEINMKMTPR